MTSKLGPQGDNDQPKSDPRKVLRIHQVAKELGYTTRTVKSMETQGLIPKPKQDWVGRFYTQDDLEEIRDILTVRWHARVLSKGRPPKEPYPPGPLSKFANGLRPIKEIQYGDPKPKLPPIIPGLDYPAGLEMPEPEVDPTEWDL